MFLANICVPGENLEKLELLKHPVTKILSEFIDLETNCGYMMFAKIGVIDFGNNHRDPIVRLKKNFKLQHNPGKLYFTLMIFFPNLNLFHCYFVFF